MTRIHFQSGSKVPYVKSPKMGHGDCNFGRHKTAKSLDVSVPAPSTRALMRWSNAGSPLPLVGARAMDWIDRQSIAVESETGSGTQVWEQAACCVRRSLCAEWGIVLIGLTSVFCATAFRTPAARMHTSAVFALICLNVRLPSPPFNQLRR